MNHLEVKGMDDFGGKPNPDTLVCTRCGGGLYQLFLKNMDTGEYIAPSVEHRCISERCAGLSLPFGKERKKQVEPRWKYEEAKNDN